MPHLRPRRQWRAILIGWHRGNPWRWSKDDVTRLLGGVACTSECATSLHAAVRLRFGKGERLLHLRGLPARALTSNTCCASATAATKWSAHRARRTFWMREPGTVDE